MDDNINRLETPEECEQYAINVEGKSPDDALAARRRAVELRALSHSAETKAEREALQAVYAYERVLSDQRKKAVRATRTWQMIKNRGILGAVERAVNRKDDPSGYTALVRMGMGDLAFEAVVKRHPEAFSAQAVARSEERLKNWRDGETGDQ